MAKAPQLNNNCKKQLPQLAWNSPVTWISTILGFSLLGLCAYPIVSENFRGKHCLELDGKIQAVELKFKDCVEKPTNQTSNVTPVSIYFGFGSSQIPPYELPKIHRYAGQIEKSPKARVTLIGHTDKTSGNGSKNHQALSKARAESVRNQLIKYGVTKQIATLAIGNAQPIFNHYGVEDESQSRRVEIKIHSY